MSCEPPDESAPAAGPGPEGAVAAGALALAGAGWLAPALGASPVVAGAGLTAGFALFVAFALRALRGRARALRDAADAARRADLRAQALVDLSAEMIVEVDGAAVRRSVSAGSHALLGYRPEELVGAGDGDLVHPDDLPAHRRALEAMRVGGPSPVVSTQRHRHKDGRYVWTEATARPRHDPRTGRPDGYVGRLRDVTERRDAREALRASEAFLRGVIDASPDCIAILDFGGRIDFVNGNGLCLLEFAEAGTPVGLDFAALWPAETRGTVEASLAAAAAGARSRFSGRCRSAKGNLLDLDVVISPVPGADGRPERLLVLSRDVSAGAKAEARLRVVQDRYRLLAEHSSDVVMLRPVGPEGRAFYVSPSAARVLGHAPDHVAEAYPGDLVHPDDRAAVRALMEGLVPDDGTVLHIHRVLRPDGSTVWIEGAFLATAGAGDPTMVLALRDVSERQQRAEDLAAAKDVAERARRSAEQASEAKSDFLAAMSHEIRTPLNSIIGFTDLMLEAGGLPGAAREQAELIRASGAALLTVVNDVLDFSKAEAGAIELEALPFAPVDLAQHCAAILRGYAGAKALDIAVEIDPRVPAALVGDEGRLRQVLLNLLNNAVKFTPSGTVTLRLSRLEGVPGRETIRFEVADTGIGIPDMHQNRLFERFSQVDSSVARRFGGSGLGLAICKKLVDLMGGSIGVTSRQGTGSTFWFTVALPVHRREEPLPLPPAAPGPPARGTLLLVEDIDINQRLAVALLEAAGHAVDVVNDGALAVAAVARKAYDLVLMDVQMPGMDGIAATRAIRCSAGPHRDVPILAMTANVFPEQIRTYREAGMDGHVGKPLNRVQLHAAVARWAGAGRAGAASPGFDQGALDDLALHLGAARLEDVLDRFAASLAHRFEAAPGEAGLRWRADAHVVLSVAGMAGFTELAARCRALEQAAPGSAEQDLALAAVRRARDAALSHLADRARARSGGPAAAENAA